MKRILTPTIGPSDWRRLLANPQTQWRRKKSAMELALSWELAEKTKRGLPKGLAEALDSVNDLRNARLILAIPEHRVPLEGGAKPSQNDVWALLLSNSGLVSMAVEGKAGETFGPTLEEWGKGASDGKRRRLESLCKNLRVGGDPPSDLRYQLFHRSASAVIEAELCGAPFAVMMVQAFRTDEGSWQDFVAFASFLGGTAEPGRVVRAGQKEKPRLYLGWVNCDCASVDQMASLV
jgi:hypothetical protein